MTFALATRKPSARQQSRQFGTHECRQWREAIFNRFAPLAGDLAKGFVAIASRQGNTAGNTWLRRVADSLIAGPWNVTHEDDALVAHAEAQARYVELITSRVIGDIRHDNRRKRHGLNAAPVQLKLLDAGEGKLSERAARIFIQRARLNRQLVALNTRDLPPFGELRFYRMRQLGERNVEAEILEHARHRALEHHIEPPDSNGPRHIQLARLSCSLWWRRKLRVLSGRRIEQVQREIGRVHKRAGIYCSDVTIDRRRSQKIRNRSLLELMEAINQDGQAYTLAELSELGLANPEHRRAELMLRIRDTEVEARRLGHVGMFYTITCPSRLHPVLSKSCQRNRKYDGSNPRQAQAYLQSLWARARAKLGRDGIGIYGVRVVEPHHDGTPHWHLLLWMHPDDEPQVTELLRSYALTESPSEPGAQRNRFKPVKIDPAKGSAAGYVAKYVAKNINGEQFTDVDHYGQDMQSSAPRIEAWAAVWGIRQFQFVGLPSVTVWREVRRMTEKQQDTLDGWEEATRPAPRASELLHRLRSVCNAGQWDQFVRLMGGPMTPRKFQPVKPWRVIRQDSTREPINKGTGEVEATGWADAKGRYGESVTTTWGLEVLGFEYLTRYYRWKIQPKGFQSDGEAAAPWTRVNNCTGVDIRPRQPDPETAAEQEKRFNEWYTDAATQAEFEAAEIDARMARHAVLNLFKPKPPPDPDEYFPDGI